MSRSFLSYQVDFYNPIGESNIEKESEKKSGRSRLGAYLGLFPLIPTCLSKGTGSAFYFGALADQLACIVEKGKNP